MKEFQIGPNDAGQRLDRFLAKAVPLLPASLAQKYIRIKRIKRNGAGWSGIPAWRPVMCFSFISMMNFLTNPGRIMPI